MKALIGANTPVGDYLLSQGKYDYIIDPSNYELLRNKQFREIVCTVADIPQPGNLVEEKDAIRIDKLIDILGETKTEVFTLITTASVLNSSDQYFNENTSLYSVENAPNAFLANRIKFDEFIQLRFGRVLTLRLPDYIFSADKLSGILADIHSADALAKYPANMPHQLFYLPLLSEMIAGARQLGLQFLNVAPEPLTTIEIVREYNPDAISMLKNAEEGTTFPPIMHSLYSIHWYDPAGYVCPKATVIQQIKDALGK